jgi:hypothetical protein
MIDRYGETSSRPGACWWRDENRDVAGGESGDEQQFGGGRVGEGASDVERQAHVKLPAPAVPRDINSAAMKKFSTSVY